MVAWAKILLAKSGDTANSVFYNTGGANFGLISPGTSGWVLTSNGSGSAPTFQAASGGGSPIWTENGFRLTASTGTPVPATDVTGATSIYLTPYKSDAIWTYDSSVWTRHTSSTDISNLLSGAPSMDSGVVQDVFIYWTGAALAIERVSWTTLTARAVVLAQQDGVWVKSTDHSRRYVGTIAGTGKSTVADSAAQRYVWNWDNPVQRVSASFDPTSSWTLSSTTFVAMNSGNAAWLREFVVGLQRDPVVVLGTIHAASGSNNPNITYGVDSTTASDAGTPIIQIQSTLASPYSFPFMKQLPIGYHYIQTISKLGGTGTATLQGTAGVDAIRMGLLVWCWT